MAIRKFSLLGGEMLPQSVFYTVFAAAAALRLANFVLISDLQSYAFVEDSLIYWDEALTWL